MKAMKKIRLKNAKWIIIFLWGIWFNVIGVETAQAQSGCIPPPDMVVSCKYWFDVSDLDVPSNPTFGRIVSSFSQRKKITTRDIVCPGFCETDRYNAYFPKRIQDGLPCKYYDDYYNPTHPDNKYNLVWGWDGVYESGMIQIEVNDLRDCGIGRIVRTFKIYDGMKWVPIAHQTIWVVNCDPFYINPLVCNDNTDDIEWPLGCNDPAILTECDPDLSPDNPLLGKPKFANGAGRYCSMVSIEYSDKRFTVEENSCFKVIRTWTVIDWCQYHPKFDARKGKWTYRQIIKVVNKTDPVIYWDSIGLNKRDSVLPDGICANLNILKIGASDDCTSSGHLRYEYKIDLFNDGEGEYGTYDLFAGRLDKPGFVAVEHDNPYALDPNVVNDASGYYPLGRHKISWYVEDGCGNVTVLDSVIEVKDTKRPTPYCKNGLVTVIMPSTGNVDIDVDRLNIGAFDNCTARENLKIYFDGQEDLKRFTVTCDSFAPGAERVEIPVEVWVEDEAGNTDYCTITVEVQEPNGACVDSLPHPIEFKLIGDDATFLKSAEVQMTDSKGASVMRAPIEADGYFKAVLDGLQWRSALNGNIEIQCANYPSDRANTRDLVRVMKHLLGKAPFSKFTEYVAADMDASGQIDLKDIILFRDWILKRPVPVMEGRYWAFVTQPCMEEQDSIPADEAFASYDARNCMKDILKGRYEMVHPLLKGDISTAALRSAENIVLEYYSAKQDANGIYIPFVLKLDGKCIDGFQIDMRMPRGRFISSGEEGFALSYNEVTESQYRLIATRDFSKDVRKTMEIRWRYYPEERHQIEGGEVKDMSLSRGFAVACSGEDFHIRLKKRTNPVASAGLYKPYPNPFSHTLNIPLRPAVAGHINQPIEIQLFSATGKALFKCSVPSSYGSIYPLEVPANWAPGLYFAVISSGDVHDTFKLIKI